jgi:hypothetical protein
MTGSLQASDLFSASMHPRPLRGVGGTGEGSNTGMNFFNFVVMSLQDPVNSVILNAIRLVWSCMYAIPARNCMMIACLIDFVEAGVLLLSFCLPCLPACLPACRFVLYILAPPL